MLHLNFSPFPQLQTARLQLRRITPADTGGVLILRSDVNAMKHIGRPLMVTEADARELIDKMESGIQQNTAIGWGITLTNDNRIIGSVGFHRIFPEHARAEIGYMLLPSYWGAGLATEAIRAALQYGFEQMNLHSVEANVDPLNAKSIRVLKKFGFVKEAYFRENFWFNGRFLDSEIYSLLKREAIMGE